MMPSGSSRITTAILQSKGFSHEEFPDGWYWFIKPVADTEQSKYVAEALGYESLDVAMVDDEIIVQVDDSLEHWSFVFGSDSGDMEIETAQQLLAQLPELR